MPGRKGPGVETWVHICNEIIHHVLPFRARTVHLLWVVTIPPVVLGGSFYIVFSVLVPNPQGWFGVAGCGAGVLLVARLRTRLNLLSAGRAAISPSEATPSPVAGVGRPGRYPSSRPEKRRRPPARCRRENQRREDADDRRTGRTRRAVADAEREHAGQQGVPGPEPARGAR